MKGTVRSLGIGLLGLALTAPVSGAQVAKKSALTLEGAKQVALAAAAEARRGEAGGAIAVVDDGGHLLYLERLDGTFPAAAEVAIEKARSAATFRRATSVFEEAVRNGRTSLVAVGPLTPLQGGVPLLVDGDVVGAIGVSGAKSAQHDDDIAQAAAANLGRYAGRGEGGSR